MPLVHLTHQYGSGRSELAGNLAKELPGIIASHLSVGERERHDGSLIPADIEVYCMEGRTRDVNTQDLEIVVFAHDYPERRANLEERKDHILADVRRFLADYDRNVTGFVWVLLCPSAFGRI